MKVLGYYFYIPILLLVAAEFGAAAVAFGCCAVLLQGSSIDTLALPSSVVLWALVFSTAVVVGITAVGLYQARQRLHVVGVLARIVVGLAIAAVLVALAGSLFPIAMEGPQWMSSFAISLMLLIATRSVLWRLLDNKAFQREVLIYGAGARAANLLDLRRSVDRRGFNIAAFVPAEGDSHVIGDRRVTRPNGSLLEYAKVQGIDEIVIAMDDRRRGFPIKDLLKCKFAGIKVIDLLAFLERETGKVKVDLVSPSWLIFSEGFGASAGAQLGARVLDVLLATVMLVLATPVMIVATVAILIGDGRPVLYRQRRVGFMGKTFTLYKFRSMICNAEADGTAKWAGRCDSRVTRVGSVFRKLRIDELPQLFNVLRGDMSLVGPRPERPEFVETLAQTIPHYHERHLVKPGITGWAQISYPYGSSEHDAREKLQYDLYYIKHRSVIFNLIVLLQTAEVVLWGKGAR